MSTVYIVTRKLGACYNTLGVFTCINNAVNYVTRLAEAAPDNSYLYWVTEFRTDFDYGMGAKGFPVGFANKGNGWVRHGK